MLSVGFVPEPSGNKLVDRSGLEQMWRRALQTEAKGQSPSSPWGFPMIEQPAVGPASVPPAPAQEQPATVGPAAESSPVPPEPAQQQPGAAESSSVPLPAATTEAC